MSDSAQEALKKRFAYLYLKNFKDGFKAAIALFGAANVTNCLDVGRSWPHDPTVIEEINNLIEAYGERHFLPGEVETASELWVFAQQMKLAGNFKAYDSAMKQYRETLGFVSSAKTPPIGNGGGVMVVPQEVTPESWERRARQQQVDLADEGNTTSVH